MEPPINRGSLSLHECFVGGSALAGGWSCCLVSRVIALLLGLIFGVSLQTADLGPVLIKQLGSIVLAVVVINLWEETVWAGFLQTRLEARFNFIVAAV